MFRCRFVSPLVAIATREGLSVPNAATLTMLPASDAEAFSRRLCALRGPHGSTKVGHGLFSRSRPLQDSTCAQRASVQRQPRHCKPKAHFASSSHPSGAPGCSALHAQACIVEVVVVRTTGAKSASHGLRHPLYYASNQFLSPNLLPDDYDSRFVK